MDVMTEQTIGRLKLGVACQFYKLGVIANVFEICPAFDQRFYRWMPICFKNLSW